MEKLTLLGAPTSPRRVQLSRARGWRKPANTLAVARPSKWGNPFRINARHDAAEQVRAFAAWLESDPAGIALAQSALKELRARTSPAGAGSTSLATPTSCSRPPTRPRAETET